MISRSNRRPGTFVPMLAICATALFSFVALATDLGMLAVARTECQNAADAAALAGARLLNNKPGVANNNRAAAEATARAVVTRQRTPQRELHRRPGDSGRRQGVCLRSVRQSV